jgi:hypothetical protein
LKSFVAKTAKATGQSRQTVQRDATRGKNVKVLTQVIGTSLDKGEELDALAKLSEASQQALAARAQTGEKVSAKTQVKKERRQEREAEGVVTRWSLWPPSRLIQKGRSDILFINSMAYMVGAAGFEPAT